MKSDTPETDAALYPMNQVDIVWPEFARKLERERDAWRITASALKAGEIDLLEGNAKLRDLAERAIEKIEQENWGIREVSGFWKQIRSELDQLKEEVK